MDPVGVVSVRGADEADKTPGRPLPEVCTHLDGTPPEILRQCYEWTRLVGLSGRVPREWDILSEPPPNFAFEDQRLLVRVCV
jgi:hypothetical protein